MYQPIEPESGKKKKELILIFVVVLLICFLILATYLVAALVEDLKWLPLREAEINKLLPNRNKVSKTGLHPEILKHVIPNSVAPSSLGDFKPTDVKTFGILKAGCDWKVHDQDLGYLSDVMSAYVAHALHNPETKTGKDALKNFEVFLNAFNETVKVQSMPWGSSGNTFAFVGALPRVLGWYLLVKEGTMHKVAADLILKIVQNPTSGVNIPQNDVISVFMTGPYILAHRYLKSNMKRIMGSSEMAYVRNHCLNMDFKTKQGADGLHHDYGFFFYGGVASYAYLFAMTTTMTLYLFYLDKTLLYPPHLILQKIRNIIYHPSIKITVPMFGIKSNFLSPVEPDSKLGIQVIPSMKFIRYFHNGFSFSMRGQAMWIPFYESTRSRNNMAHYWVQYRALNHPKTSVSLKWPEVGFVREKSKTHEEHIKLPVLDGAFRSKYMPAVAESFVAQHDKFGMIYSHYKIPQMGNFEIWELVEMNEADETITMTAFVKNLSDANKVHYFTYNSDGKITNDEQLTKHGIEPSSSYLFKTVCNLRYDSVKMTYEKRADNPLEKMSLTLGDYSTKPASKVDAVILYKNNKPKVLSFVSQPNFERSYKIKGVTFKFDRSVNQYVV